MVAMVTSALFPGGRYLPGVQGLFKLVNVPDRAAGLEGGPGEGLPSAVQLDDQRSPSHQVLLVEI